MGSGKQQQSCLGCTRKCLKIHGIKQKDLSSPPSPVSSFFKIMIGDFSRILFIPPKYARRIQNLVNQHIYLEDSYRKFCKVKLSMLDNSMAFRHGWEEFVTDHSIQFGEMVVFKHVCKSHFVVKIFGISGCERTHFSEKNDGKIYKRNRTNVQHFSEPPICLHNDGKNDDSATEQGKHAEYIHKRKRTIVEHFTEPPITLHNVGKNDESLKEKGCSSGGNSLNKEKESRQMQSDKASVEELRENENGCSVTSDLSLITHPLNVGRTTVGSRRVPLNINDETSIHKLGGSTSQVIDSGVTEAQSTPAVEFSDYDVQYRIVRATPKFLLAEDGICYIVYEKSIGELGPNRLFSNLYDNAPQSVDNTTECYGCYTDIGDTFEAGSQELEERVDPCSKENILKPVNTETMSRIVNYSPSVSIHKHPHTGNRWLGSSGGKPDIIFKTPEATCVGNAIQSTGNTTERHGCHIDVGGSLQAEGTAGSKENKKVNHCTKQNALKLVKTEKMDVILNPSRSPANFSLSVTISSEPWLVLMESLLSRVSKLKYERKVVYLCDPATRVWPVLYHESNKFTGFHACWKDFATANNIHDGDVCTFELAEQSDSMFQVQISKAQR